MYAGPMPGRRITTGSDAETLVPEAFLPVAYRDMEELDGFLEHLAARCSIRGIARCSTNCSEMRGFAPSSGGRPARERATMRISED